MSVSRRKLYGLKATVAYLFFAVAWILLSDNLLARFGDPQSLARYGTFKGVAFVLATGAILWFTLMNAPADADVDARFGAQPGGHNPWMAIAWGMTVPSLAALVQWTFWDHLRPFAWVLGYPAVLASAWLGGWVASLTATGVWATLAWSVFAPTHPDWAIQQPSGMVAMGIFVASGILVSASIEWMRRAEQRSGNSKFQALVEQTLAGIYIVQQDRFVYVNPAFARMLGYDHADQVIGTLGLTDVVAPGDREKMREQLQIGLNQPGKEMRHGFTGLRRDGSTIELDVHGRGLQTLSGAAVIGLALDVTDHDSIKAAVAHAETEMGTIDILINNSGVSTTQKLVDVTEDDYDFIFDTNTKGAFFVAQEVGKRMLARAKGAAPGTFTGGRIVNIASMAGLRVLGQIGSALKTPPIDVVLEAPPVYEYVPDPYGGPALISETPGTQPTNVRVDRMGPDGIAGDSVRFGLKRDMGCYWLDVASLD